jgi:adenylate cyclase class 2
MYEVELKFPVQDAHAAWTQLAALGAERGEPVSQADQYFAHPCRSFAATDEALRVRSVGAENTLTYKGPVIDTRTKMRREIEVGFRAGREDAGRLTDILQQLGFQPVRTVAKTRWSGTLQWEGREIGWTWDDVPPLGTFVELELVVDEQERQSARDLLCRLADGLRLGLPERRSYLELLLALDNS